MLEEEALEINTIKKFLLKKVLWKMIVFGGIRGKETPQKLSSLNEQRNAQKGWELLGSTKEKHKITHQENENPTTFLYFSVKDKKRETKKRQVELIVAGHVKDEGDLCH